MYIDKLENDFSLFINKHRKNSLETQLDLTKFRIKDQNSLETQL